MQTLVIDTNSIVKKLEGKGFSRSQAEGVTEALKELDTSSLSTKADLKNTEQRLELAMRDKTITIIKWVSGILVAQSAATAGLTVALLQFVG